MTSFLSGECVCMDDQSVVLRLCWKLRETTHTHTLTLALLYIVYTMLPVEQAKWLKGWWDAVGGGIHHKKNKLQHQNSYNKRFYLRLML